MEVHNAGTHSTAELAELFSVAVPRCIELSNDSSELDAEKLLITAPVAGQLSPCNRNDY